MNAGMSAHQWPRRALLMLFLMLTASACAPRAIVVLLPDSDGNVGKVSITNAAGAQVLEKSSTAVEIASAEAAPQAPRAIDQKEIQAIFGEALKAAPEPPVIFRVYFFSGKAQPTPQSLPLFAKIFAAIRARDPVRIAVVGHSDRFGSDAFNLRLSLRRASAVRDRLVGEGISADTITVSSHGENNPLKPTADNVREPLNRRVDVLVK